VFFALGAWYVPAYCHRARAERMFRVDRIRGVRRTGSTFEQGPALAEAGEVYSPRADDPRVRLHLSPAVVWVAEAYPTESVTELADGGLEVVLAVSEPAWLERLLLQLGPEARVVDPPEAARHVADTARRVLERYTRGDSVAGPGGRRGTRTRTGTRDGA
jgi:proteasome accessory factor C